MDDKAMLAATSVALMRQTDLVAALVKERNELQAKLAKAITPAPVAGVKFDSSADFEVCGVQFTVWFDQAEALDECIETWAVCPIGTNTDIAHALGAVGYTYNAAGKRVQIKADDFISLEAQAAAYKAAKRGAAWDAEEAHDAHMTARRAAEAA